MRTPLRICFDVACPVEHAFKIWTSRINTWWPRDHTVAGRDDLSVVLQNEVGGRIYERTADGIEHQSRDRNRAGWQTLLPHYRAALATVIGSQSAP